MSSTFRNDLIQLMDIESNLTDPQKRQIANNLIFFLRLKYAGTIRNADEVNLVLVHEPSGVYRLEVTYGIASVFQGYPATTRESALAALGEALVRKAYEIFED